MIEIGFGNKLKIGSQRGISSDLPAQLAFFANNLKQLKENLIGISNADSWVEQINCISNCDSINDKTLAPTDLSKFAVPPTFML